MSAGAGETRRSREEMAQALKRQVRLLRDYAQKAFIEGNDLLDLHRRPDVLVVLRLWTAAVSFARARVAD
jgi:phenylalanine-4-hydroxylase